MELQIFHHVMLLKRLILNVNEHYQILNFNIRIIKKKTDLVSKKKFIKFENRDDFFRYLKLFAIKKNKKINSFKTFQTRLFLPSK